MFDGQSKPLICGRPPENSQNGFWARDIRGGLGERETFKRILKQWADTYPEMVRKNLKHIPFYGRWDDVLSLLNTNVHLDVIDLIRNQLNADLETDTPSLLGKWLPSINAGKKSKDEAYKISRELQMSPRQYRKLCVKLRKQINIVEHYISKNEIGKIDFSHVPSKAALMYAGLFFKKDETRYRQYLSDVAKNKAKINAGTLTPYDVIDKCEKISSGKINLDRSVLDVMWENLPNYFEGREETGLCVVDVSGSMDGIPMTVAISLGMYCADKAKGPFNGNFITFSADPEICKIEGRDIFTKYQNVKSSEWGMNTDIVKVFMLILKTAVRNKCDPSEVPNKLYIISDMQFDAASRCTSERRKTLFESIASELRKHGYTMPDIVFWNVRTSNCGMHQFTIGSDIGYCEVSGFNPSLFKTILDGSGYSSTEETKTKLDPYCSNEHCIGKRTVR